MSTNNTDTIVHYSLTYSIKFAVLLSLQIPSILVSLIIFFYFGCKYTTRVTDHNRSILVLLLINFLQVITNLPMPMSFYRSNGFVQPATSAYCTWWIWYEFSLNTINGMLIAWVSIERYLLMFHNNFIRNIDGWKRRVLPLVVFSLWGPLYYFLTVIISPMCTNIWEFDQLLCGLPCYLSTNWGTFDLFFDVISPVLFIFIFDLVLFIRVVNKSMIIVGRTRNNWRRQRMMALQLGIISFVYQTVWIPLSIIELGQIYINPNFLLEQLDAFNFLVHIVPPILPIVYLMSLSKLIKKIKNLLRQQHTAVLPLNELHIRQNNTNRPLTMIVIRKF